MNFFKERERSRWKALKKKVKNIDFFNACFVNYANYAKNLSYGIALKKYAYELLDFAATDYEHASEDDKHRIITVIEGIHHFLSGISRAIPQELLDTCTELDQSRKIKQCLKKVLGGILVCIALISLLATVALLITALTLGTGGLASTAFAFLVPMIQFVSGISVVGIALSDAAAMVALSIGAAIPSIGVGIVGGLLLDTPTFTNFTQNIKKEKDRQKVLNHYHPIL